MFDTRGLRTTYGSRIFATYVPTRTAEAVTRLEAAGAILVGKANQHEFAWG
jgi:aspartyl-tRNA(Asn)/glutamyl-tRNA(Gln) amidotransferase subunit A